MYLTAVCIWTIIPPLRGGAGANMHLTFGSENNSGREFEMNTKQVMHSLKRSLMLQDAPHGFCL